MSSSFEHTLRSVSQRNVRCAWLLPGLALLAGWGAWMLHAELAVYATTATARVEVSRMPSHVAAEASGRVARFALELNRPVERGDELLVLDSSVQDAELAELAAAHAALLDKRVGVEAQLEAERSLRGSRGRLASLTSERAELSLRKAMVTAAHREQLSSIAVLLRNEQLNSQIDAVTASGELQQSQLAVTDAATEIARIAAEHDYQDKTELTRIAELRRQLIDVDAERAATESAMATKRAGLARLRVLAKVSGYVGHVSPLQLGDVVQAGQLLATIVPSSTVRVVAHFPPRQAAGLVLSGQPARVRLDGFSYLEFGALEAVVARTASEPQDGLIRVELTLQGTPPTTLPLQHGQTASVDIETDRASPWALVQRSVGRALTAPSPAAGERLALEPAP